MLKKLMQCLVVLFILHAITSFATEPQDVDKTVMKALNEMREEYDIPGIYAAIYIQGKPYTYQIGYAQQEKKIPITKDTIFEIGSLTKLMTVILLAQEVDKAKTSLDTPIGKYLTYLPDNFKALTFKNLATFTVNFPLKPPPDIKTKQALIHYLTELNQDLEVGKVRKYSNISIGFIGDALEVMTHKNLNQLYRERILVPLHMQPIALTVPSKIKNNLAQGYTRNDELALPENYNLLPSSYGMKASGEDMRKFLSYAIGLNKKPTSLFYPLRLTQVGYVDVPEELQGLVWKIYVLDEDGIDLLLDDPSNTINEAQPATFIKQPRFNDNTLLDKTGTTDGFRTYIAVLPKYQSGIVVLVNKNVSDEAIVKTARLILLKLTGLAKNNQT